jgi:hypothetical protein
VTAVRVRLKEVECFEREVPLRLPFRFGVTTVTHAIQAVVRVRVSLEDGRTATGVAAESLAAKWFEKSPEFSDAQNLDQLRQALESAIALYGEGGFQTPFGLYASTYEAQLARGAELGLNPLVASYGPALLDRAILDATGRALGLSFQDMVRTGVVGVSETDLTPDLAGFDVPGFLAGLKPAPAIAVRHTVGMLDPLTASDQPAGTRVGDGLPETLEEVARYYGGRFYKLKVGGDVAADLERLSRIADVLDREAGEYWVTLDGNEQYDDVDGVAELWGRMRAEPRLGRLVEATLFIEQPIRRSVALSRPIDRLARERPLIIDESDGDLSAFPRAIELGYSGVSSKTCKGLYKSILNAARVSKRNAEAGQARLFMSAEDLTTWPGVSVQQDLALVSLLGLTHVERNAHHFIDGMSFAPKDEQAAFAEGHPDLYVRTPGRPVRLRIKEGHVSLASLNGRGFAVGAEMDFSGMRPMPAAPKGRIIGGRPQGANAA